MPVGRLEDASGAEMDRPLGKRGWSLLVAGMVLHAIVYVLLNTPTPRVLRGDEVRYRAEAISIADGVFPPPDFLWPPLQKWFLGSVYALFGDGWFPIAAIQTALFLASAVLLRKLALRLGLGMAAADTAMGLFLLDPQIGSFALFLWPEVIHLFLVLAALALLFPGRVDLSWRAFGGGACLGLAMLAKSVFGPFLPVVLLATTARHGLPSKGGRLLRAAGAATGLALVVLPVVLWNGSRHGYWGMASSGVFNLWVGLNDPPGRVDYDSVVQRGLAIRHSSGRLPAEKDRDLERLLGNEVRERGLFPILRAQLGKQYARLLDRKSFLTDQLPGGRWRPGESPRAADRLLEAWGTSLHVLTLVLSSFGMALAISKSDIRRLALPLLVVCYGLGLFLLLHAKTRYRVPFLPALDVLAGLTVARLAAWTAGRERPRASWLVPRLVAGAALSTLAILAALPVL